MHRKILVPLDGSDFAEAALPLALSIVERTEGELHLVTAVPTLPAVTPASDDEGPVKGWFEEERVRATKYLESIKARVLQASPDTTVHLRVLSGQAVAALDERIRKTDVDLVVMTTHGRGPLERMWLGSVADGLIREAPCPILLERPENGEVDLTQRPSVERIVVPLDGSEASEGIIPHARTMAKAFGAHLYLFTVFIRGLPLGSTYIPHAAQEEEDREAVVSELRRYLERMAEQLRGKGLEVETEVWMGDDASSKILAFAEEVEADLIAIPTRGRGGVARLVVGSVADKVIRGGTAPVLTYRRRGG
jgi:nucleotide-binding universal stress UspA family protein